MPRSRRPRPTRPGTSSASARPSRPPTQSATDVHDLRRRPGGPRGGECRSSPTRTRRSRSRRTRRIYWDYDELAKSYVARSATVERRPRLVEREPRAGNGRALGASRRSSQGLATVRLPPHGTARRQGRRHHRRRRRHRPRGRAPLLRGRRERLRRRHERGGRRADRLRGARGLLPAVDVADPDSVQAMYAATAERYGGIDVLYNNAGSCPRTTGPSWTRSRTPGSTCRT